MWFVIFKIVVSAVVIAALSELAKRLPMVSGLLTAMPITTLLVLFWIYMEEGEYKLLHDFSVSVFWGIFPTLFFFGAVIWCFKREVNFFATLTIGLAVWAVFAWIHLRLMKTGVRLF